MALCQNYPKIGISISSKCYFRLYIYLNIAYFIIYYMNFQFLFVDTHLTLLE